MIWTSRRWLMTRKERELHFDLDIGMEAMANNGDIIAI